MLQNKEIVTGRSGYEGEEKSACGAVEEVADGSFVNFDEGEGLFRDYCDGGLQNVLYCPEELFIGHFLLRRMC